MTLWKVTAGFFSMMRSLLLAAMLLACSPSEPLAGNRATAQQLAAAKEKSVACDKNAAPAVANLPFSHGHSFRTLDEYLAHLRQYAGPIDQPWWREIRPGVYEHVTRLRAANPEIATRAELMQRFGFSC